MDEYFQQDGELFEWDQNKSKTNAVEHKGITFWKAVTTFGDPLALTFDDEEHSSEELRECLIGRAADGALLRVSYTVHESGFDL